MPENQTYCIYDSHAHYEDSAFDEDRAQLLGEKLPGAGVRCVLNMGTRIRTCAAAMGLAEAYPYIYAAVGIHPEEVGDGLPENWIDCLRSWLEGGAVAVGEIGLDYHWKDSAPGTGRSRSSPPSWSWPTRWAFPCASTTGTPTRTCWSF